MKYYFIFQRRKHNKTLYSKEGTATKCPPVAGRITVKSAYGYILNTDF